MAEITTAQIRPRILQYGAATIRRCFSLLARDQRGIAAVEFALMTPLLILLWLGGIEITNALIVDRKVNAMTTSVAELIDRASELTESDVEAVFDFVAATLDPLNKTIADIRLTAIDVDDEGVMTVAWSRSRGNYNSHPQGGSASTLLDAKAVTPGLQALIAEVAYDYEPQFGFGLTGSLKLEDKMVFLPRTGTSITLCASQSAC